MFLNFERSTLLPVMLPPLKYQVKLTIKKYITEQGRLQSMGIVAKHLGTKHCVNGQFEGQG